MQGSLHAANTIRRRLQGDERALPFRYRDLGSVATIGRFRAVAQLLAVPVERTSRLDRLVLRAPRVPERVRRPLHHGVPLVRVDGRPHPHRTGLQRRAHRWRLERARRRAGPWAPTRSPRCDPRAACSPRVLVRSRRVITYRRARRPFREPHPAHARNDCGHHGDEVHLAEQRLDGCRARPSPVAAVKSP